MKVYRYEKPDGGGPFFTFYGINRFTHQRDDDNFLSGCLSIEDLKKYFLFQEDILEECVLQEYDIPDEEIEYGASHVYFPKKYSQKYLL